MGGGGDGCSGGGVGVWVAREGRGAVGGRGGGCAGGGVGEGCGWAVSACGCWGRLGAVGAVGAVRAVGAGGAGGRAGAAIKHYFLSFGGASFFLGGKEDMWAVRAVGMEACGRWGRWV